MKTLGKIKTKKRVRRTAEVDITAFSECAEDETVLLTFMEPGASELFLMAQDGKDEGPIHVQYPDWPEGLRKSVAMLGASHVAPEPDEDTSAGQFYANMAEENSDLFAHVLAAYQAAFPAVADYDAAKDAEKKT